MTPVTQEYQFFDMRAWTERDVTMAPIRYPSLAGILDVDSFGYDGSKRRRRYWKKVTER